MNICSYCDIVYTSKHCPLCKADEEIKILEKLNEELNERIDDFNYKIIDLRERSDIT